MKLTEAEMRMVFQIESTNQNAALNEIYMTWRYAPNPATKETAESLLDKLRSLSDQECMDLIRKVQAEYREVILDNIEYSYLVQDSHIDREQLDEIVDLIVDTVCSARKVIRIAGDDYPAEVVKSRFMKLDSSHVQYVMDCMKDNTTYVRNIKKYLLAALYNAPTTINSYYSSLVQHDMYGDGQRGRG